MSDIVDDIYFFFNYRVLWLFFFFFSSRRRHTRYWRDWSSDVCSSDLDVGDDHDHTGGDEPPEPQRARRGNVDEDADEREDVRVYPERDAGVDDHPQREHKIGRASCRERGEISVVAGSIKKKRQ